MNDCLTIAEFCASEKISRSMFYKMLKMGAGPRVMQVGTHKRISPEARADWRRQCEARPQPGKEKRRHPRQAA
jgi:hypothetical protein